jgi:4-aminobutyrate aminotransferase-like enzyme
MLGERIKGMVESLRYAVPQIAEVRGPGAMVAIEFCRPHSSSPDAQFAKRVQKLSLDRGLVLLLCGVYGNVIRFLLPLTTPERVLTEGLNILESALREAAAADSPK